MSRAVIAGLLALGSPLILWPLEQVLAVPYLIEEVFKWWLMRMVIEQEREEGQRLLAWVFLVGLGITMSETMFYLMNMNMLGSLDSLGKRLLLTNGMHFLTLGLIYWGVRQGGKKLKWSFLGAVLIHLMFNVWVG
ncbi:hypothetical protein ACFL18_02840 [Patescibacteria group bacterium]